METASRVDSNWAESRRCSYICTLWNPQNPSEPEKNKYSDLTSENWKCSEFEGCIFKAAPFMVVKQNKAKGINDRSIK